MLIQNMSQKCYLGMSRADSTSVSLVSYCFTALQCSRDRDTGLAQYVCITVRWSARAASIAAAKLARYAVSYRMTVQQLALVAGSDPVGNWLHRALPLECCAILTALL